MEGTPRPSLASFPGVIDDLKKRSPVRMTRTGLLTFALSLSDNTFALSLSDNTFALSLSDNTFVLSLSKGTQIVLR